MAVKDELQSLFIDELTILDEAKRDIRDGEHAGSPLWTRYTKLAAAYETLLNFALKATKISDAQGRSLMEREHKLKSLLDSSSQGFFTFGPDLLVHPEYSAACERIFAQGITGKHAAALLCTDAQERERHTHAFRTALNQGDPVPMQTLPSSLAINARHIHAEYKLIRRTEDEKAILAILTDVTERMTYEARVKHLSERDPLSSLFNRTYVEEIVPKLLNSALPLSVVLLDLNALKLTNDVFGHEAGDRLIVNAAEVLKTLCRPGDVAARWGGDEFLVVLPRTDNAEALRFVERVRVASDEAKSDLVDLSLSVGVATTHDSATDFTRLFADAETQMYKSKLLERRTVRRKIVERIERVLEDQGLVPVGHIERVKRLVVAFAKELGIQEKSVVMNNLLLMASLHDIGKVVLPFDMLNKEEPLTADEWAINKGYPETGYRMAESIGEPAVAEGILALRERWDGTGYPSGLTGEHIPYLSRLFALVEVYDIMTHDTVYRPAMSADQALHEIRQQRGRQFDPDLTDSFLAFMAGPHATPLFP